MPLLTTTEPFEAEVTDIDTELPFETIVSLAKGLMVTKVSSLVEPVSETALATFSTTSVTLMVIS